VENSLKLNTERQKGAEHKRLAHSKEWSKPIQLSNEIRIQYIGEIVTTNQIIDP